MTSRSPVWGRTYGLKPSTDINLSMAFPAVMPCTSSIRRFIVPLDDGEILVSALNHEPVNGIRRYCSTDFTTKFAYCRHRVNCNSRSAHPHCHPPAKLSVDRSMKHPALQQLLQDVDSGKIDTVVVYKMNGCAILVRLCEDCGWTGGCLWIQPPVIGTLLVNKKEAEQVRRIFEQYLELGCVAN